MIQELLGYLDARIKDITELEIQALHDNNQKESAKLNSVKIELLDAKIFVCDQAMKDLKSTLNAIS